jgi:hypothetical protein
LNYAEDDLLEFLIEKAKKDAENIKNGTPETMTDFLNRLRFWWAKHYNRPMKDPLLDQYTTYELLLEYHLFTEVDQTKVTNTIISENTEELTELFKDFEDLSEDEEAFMEKAFGPADQASDWKMTEEDFK